MIGKQAGVVVVEWGVGIKLSGRCGSQSVSGSSANFYVSYLVVIKLRYVLLVYCY